LSAARILTQPVDAKAEIGLVSSSSLFQLGLWATHLQVPTPYSVQAQALVSQKTSISLYLQAFSKLPRSSNLRHSSSGARTGGSHPWRSCVPSFPEIDRMGSFPPVRKMKTGSPGLHCA